MPKESFCKFSCSFLLFNYSSEHARGVASLAAELLARQGLSHAGYIGGLLHDCGKFTEEFSAYLTMAAAGEKVKRGSIIHTFAGVRYLLENFHSSDALKLDDLPAEILAAGIGSHHGLMDIWDQQMENGFEHRMNKQPVYDAKAIRAFIECCAGVDEIKDLYQKAKSEIIDFYKDRIAAYAKNNADGYFAMGMLTRLITSAIIDSDRTDTACFMQGQSKPKEKTYTWEEEAFIFDPEHTDSMNRLGIG